MPSGAAPARPIWPTARSSRADFEQSGGTLATADAHGDDDELHAAAATLDESMSQQPGTRCAVRMSHSDGPAIHIQPLIGQAESVAAVEDLHREGLIQLPQTHILELDAGALQQTRDREDGAD